MLLAELVDTSAAVSATRARREKIGLLAELLARLAPEEVLAAVGFLSGEPRQGKIGVGWATVSGIEVQSATAPMLTIGDLDTALSEVQATTGPGSVGQRAELLGALLQRATTSETEFVRRLLVGELRQGALEGIMAEAVAKAASVKAREVRRALMLSGDIGRTAALALAGGVDALATVTLTVGRPVQPMLASTSEGLAEALDEVGEASVQWKLDGIRVQVHKRGDAVAVYTRNLNDVTASVPEIVAVARALPAAVTVLDGEAIGLAEGDRPQRFQDTVSNESVLTPYFFDVLHLDGVDLIDQPLRDRLAALGEAVGDRRMPGLVDPAPADAERFMAEALDAGHEGVMVKGLDSLYEAGRRGKAWRKVKPVHTLDLVVLAAEWGHGRRSGWLSNLHLGARDPAGGFVMVGKTFKGMTDELLAWQTEELQRLKTHQEGIAVHVRPERVVEIAVDGVQASTRYSGGVALRFARVKHYRPDKAPGDADTIDTVRAMLPPK